MVTGMGATKIFDEVIARSAVDGVPLADPAAVLFSLASQYVGPWMATVMGVLVITSLFAGLLAFQNASARYFFAMGRGGVLPAIFARTNKAGAPAAGALLTSVIAGLVIVGFAAANLDPILNLFFWMSATTVIALILVEVLVSIAVVRYFMKNGGANIWQAKIAPIASIVLLVFGEYLLMSRFNLLSGTVPDGVDPSLAESAWQLNTFGWVLVLSPFIAAALGYVWAKFRMSADSEIARDMMS
jgi:amino acid transporter